MKKFLFLVLFFLNGCAGIKAPDDFLYIPVKAGEFELATWQKITNPTGVYKFYIEGDGYAFNRYGQPTSDPTPRGTLVRELAFGDDSPNVIYLARPCQYIKSGICAKRHWSTARFAPETVKATGEAVKKISNKNNVILVGFSGGAQMAGLIAVRGDINVMRVITVAGNLDHLAWTEYHTLPALNESMNLADYHQIFDLIPQTHYAGEKDEVIPAHLIKAFSHSKEDVIVVKGANHGNGWEEIYPEIRQVR